MRFNETTGKAIAGYSALLGLIYLAFGVVEVMAGLGFLKVPFVPADIFGGTMLLIVASVFFAGINEQWKGSREGFSFLVVGVILTAVFCGLYILIMASNALGHLLRFEEYLEWTWLENLRPGIWLFPSVLPAAYLTAKKGE